MLWIDSTWYHVRLPDVWQGVWAEPRAEFSASSRLYQKEAVFPASCRFLERTELCLFFCPVPWSRPEVPRKGYKGKLKIAFGGWILGVLSQRLCCFREWVGKVTAELISPPALNSQCLAAEGWLREGRAISHKSLCSLGTLEASPLAGMARPHTAPGWQRRWGPETLREHKLELVGSHQSRPWPPSNWLCYLHTFWLQSLKGTLPF